MGDKHNQATQKTGSGAGALFFVVLLVIVAAGASFMALQASQRASALATVSAQQKMALIQAGWLVDRYYGRRESDVLGRLKAVNAEISTRHQHWMATISAAKSLGGGEMQPARELDVQLRDFVNRIFSFVAPTTQGEGRKSLWYAITAMADKSLMMAMDAAVMPVQAGIADMAEKLRKAAMGLWGAVVLALFWLSSSAIAPLRRQVQKLNDDMQRLAATDNLTGIYNRAMLFKLGDMLLSSARRHKKTYAALMIEVDGFRDINDKYGRAAGDAVLKTIAGSLTSVLRTSDVLGRVGGNEFGVFLPSTDEYGASLVAEKLRAAVGEAVFALKDNQLILSVSIGAAGLKETHKRSGDMRRAAETAVEAAKAKGGNVVVKYDDAHAALQGAADNAEAAG